MQACTSTTMRTKPAKRVRFETADPEADQKQRVLDEMHNRYSDGSLSPEVLMSVLEQLSLVPHVGVETPDARSVATQHLIRMDMFREAATKAQHTAYNAWCMSKWDVQHTSNCMAIDAGHPTSGEAPVIDGCAICGEVKSKCVDVANHFGAKGESPPDSRCLVCNKNYGNEYDSGKRLALHVAVKHA
jgi:hypothetical protein